MNQKIICLIPARGGSKGVPLKNIHPVNGKPLIVYSIESARASALVDRIIVSTDHPEIAAVARAAGAEVPFMRPAEISADDTPDLPVFEHFIEWCRKHENFEPDILVHLRPTSPLRRMERIDQAIQMMIDDPSADSVRSVCLPRQSPFKMWSIDPDGWLRPLISGPGERHNLPRQLLPPVYWHNGYIDVVRGATVTRLHSMTGNSIRPLILDPDESNDIDSWADLEEAARKLMLRPE